MKFVGVLLVASLLPVLASTAARGDDLVQISEFMASNVNSIDDEDGDNEDWIELHNAGTNTVNLIGWSLTDTTNNMRKWVFPSVILPQDSYLIVFASNKDRKTGELHTNFRLSGDGEYLALVRSNGTVATEFSPTFPIQAPDISYGLRGNTAQETILAPGAPAKAFVPFDNSLEPPPSSGSLRPWTLDGLNESAWLSGFTGVGYEADTGYEQLLGLNVISMRNTNETVYIRTPFVVNDPSVITALTLRMRFDDGFIAYINGREVAWNNSPEPSVATWNSAAPANRADSSAVVPMDFNISAFLGFIHVGTNILAIQGLNNGVASSDLLILPEILATVTGAATTTLRYFPAPTPGEANNAGVSQLGPIIEEEEHHPAVPNDNDPIRITARIRPARGTVNSAALHYRVNFGAEVTIPFLDDGNSGDEGIGDTIYGAIIPANAASAGQMVRWYITATDTTGGSSRLPVFVEPLNSPEFFGTIVADPSLTNPLPVLYWFIQNPGGADSDAGARASLFYDGEFYDNVLVNLHGQSSRGFPKKSYDVDLHPGHNFKWKAGEPRADDINLLTTYPDKAHMRNALAYETYRDIDNAYHWVIPARVQQNGVFWGTVHIVENGDQDWLIRMGLNENGALYKMYNTFSALGDTTSGAEKKTRKSENNSDLVALFNGISLTGEPRRRYMYDNMNIGQIVNFLAGQSIIGDTDCCHKNYYFYRDTGFSDEWQMWPWDVDLSFGRVWTGAQTYWQQTLDPTTPLFVGDNNKLIQAIFGTPEIRQMYLRRVRTLMDELMKPPGTPVDQLHWEPRIDELAAQIGPDAALDAAKWGSDSWGNGSTAPCCKQPFPDAVAEMKNSYLPARRNQLFNKLAGGTTELPAAQPAGTVINFGSIEVNPSTGNQEEESIQLRNPNAFAVDISDWTLSGAISFTFRGGTVMPANGNLVVAANRRAWRARSGNQAIQVVGDYQGRLSTRGETIDLTDRQGVKISTTNTPALPSAAQSYLRITEIMYHPPVLPGDGFDREEYEYVELKNIGPNTINLTGVAFTNGIFFNFSGSAVTNLGSGQRVLIVKNTAAFAERYGPVSNIGGVYSGYLDNSGNRLRLEDASHEKILDFSYNNSWYPITDGRGFSLVIVNANASFDTWGLKESWRPGGHEYGTPGLDDSPLPAVAGILINEVLSHTDLPQKDAIELFNPTASPVNISGWYITDDPGTPKKFRIPTISPIPAGGYALFTEDDFNPTPGLPPSFSFGSTGDEAYIFSANAAGELTGYHQGFSFDASATGVSFGRYIDSQGKEQFVAMATLTLGAANSAPKVGPVVISEINYHPPLVQEGIDFVEAFEDEYIELRNITATPLPLFDTNLPANTWQLRGGADFDFPTNVTIPANGQLLVVSFNPANNPTATAAFRSRHGLSGGVLLAGPYQGHLGNDGDDVRLRRPDAPEAGAIPYILVDRVNYGDNTPWPLAADGFGPSLQRLNLNAFGNDPVNWIAAAITPAANYPGGNPPVITSQPTNRVVVATSNATFSVTASGDAPLQYQWTFNGDTLNGMTNSTLVLPNAQLNQQGTYQVIVLNGAGSAASSNATLTVLIPVKITQQPQSIQANLGATAIFVVQASSSSPVSYQWRKNNVPLSGKTNSFLNIPNISSADAGSYDVVVTDIVSSVASSPAQLTVIDHPVLTAEPANQSVTVLSTPVNVTFLVNATSATPLRYQWYFNGVAMTTATNIPSVTATNLLINSVQLQNSGDYFVIVSDNFGSVTSRTARLTVNTRAEYSALPISQSVPEGSSVALSAAWSGSGPFLHRWRRTSPTPSITFGFLAPSNGLGRLMLTNGYITASATNSVLVLTNLGTNFSGVYDIIVSNAVGQIPSAPAATVTIVPDTDRDGLPDSWETGRPGFSPNDPSDALRDDDGDGVNNAREYFAGTDYLNPASYLKSVIQASGQVQLNFQAVSNRTYMVQYSETLNATQWVNLVIEPGKTNSRTATVIDPTPRPNRFYRIVTPAQP